jgi:glucose-1-phosphate thymidylyltransferase
MIRHKMGETKPMTFSAYILAAGKGTRMYPYSERIIKPLLPIINKPLLIHVVENLLESEVPFEKIGIVVREGEKQIQEIMEKHYPKIAFEYVTQEKPLGTGHAVLQLENQVDQKDFLVIAGDSLFSAESIKKLVSVHKKECNAVTLALEKMDFEQMRYSSTVKFSNRRVWDIKEKPQTKDEVLSNLNSAAMYIFSHSIFNALKDIQMSIRSEYELASAIKLLLNKDLRVGGSVVSRVVHISNSFDLWRFNQEFLAKSQNLDINGNLIGEGVTIASNAKVVNSIIGNQSQILKNVEIINSIVLPNSVIDKSYRNSLVLSNHAETFKL